MIVYIIVALVILNISIGLAGFCFGYIYQLEKLIKLKREYERLSRYDRKRGCTGSYIDAIRRVTEAKTYEKVLLSLYKI